jgi:hypothetical protein
MRRAWRQTVVVRRTGNWQMLLSLMSPLPHWPPQQVWQRKVPPTSWSAGAAASGLLVSEFLGQVGIVKRLSTSCLTVGTESRRSLPRPMNPLLATRRARFPVSQATIDDVDHQIHNRAAGHAWRTAGLDFQDNHPSTSIPSTVMPDATLAYVASNTVDSTEAAASVTARHGT